jgi:glycosyltransferase involved in cell wall biosynthesis
MMIEAHIIAWNESETIHLTIKHYQSFCSHIVIWDNHSTDNTREIAKSLGCTVKTFGVPGELSDRAYIDLKNECWKKKHGGADRRDFVIVCDADEIIVMNGPWYNFRRLSVKEPKASIFKTQGFNVFHENVPRESWLEITNGVPDGNYSKNIIFDPKRITDINYRIGAHTCSPKGQVIWSEETLWLLHYRNVGGPERLVKRHALYRPRMSKENIHRRWGHHYLEEVTDEIRVKEWHEKYQSSKPLELFSGAGISR